MSEYKSQSLSQLQKLTARALDAKIPGSLRWVTANALAGLSYMLHGHIDYLADSSLPDRAEGEHLERWAGIFGLKRKGAVPLRIEIEASSDKPVPELWIAGNDLFRLIGRDENRITLEATKDIKAVSSKTVEPYEASEGYGKASFKEVQEPQRAKTDEELRASVLRTIRNPAHGGNYLDYINWAESIPGVRRAFVKTADLCGEPGRVEVTFLEDGFKTTKTKELEDLLDRVAPAHAEVTVVAPKIRHVDIKYELTPDNKKLRAQVDGEIRKFFERESQPGGFRNESGRVTPGQISLSRLNAAMSNVPGEQDHTIIRPTKHDLVVRENELLIPRFHDED